MASPSFTHRATVVILTISAIFVLIEIGGIVATLLWVGLLIWLIGQIGKWGASPTKKTQETKISTPTFEVQASITREADGNKLQQLAVPDNLWIKPGDTVEIHGLKFESGFLYVGKSLSSVGSAYQEEPALLNPKYQIQDILAADYRVAQLSYWSSYAQASPEARTAYLHWLLKGKNDPDADIGYIFLYYYGLERRALADTESSSQAKAELPAIEQEVRRLLSLYNKGSFQHHASTFLDYLDSANNSEKVYLQVPPQLERKPQGLPFTVKLALGQLAQDSQPVPAEWAYTWIMAEPSIRLRTPAHRCDTEFHTLFKHRYQEKFGTGLKLTKNKTRLKLTYQAASPTFSKRSFTRTLDLPDISVVSSPLKLLQAIVDQCMADLDAYSRFLGRSPDKANTFEAQLELPTVVWPEQYTKQLLQIKTLIEAAPLPLAILSAKFRAWFPDWNDFSKPRMTLFAQRITELGLAMEPDPRFGGAVLSEAGYVVLFTDDGSFAKPNQRYFIASLSLHLAVSVSTVEGDPGASEKELLTTQLEKWLHLEPSEKQRLRAHLRWLLTEKPGLNGIQKRIEMLSAEAKSALGNFLTEVAQVDNQVTPAEVKMLEKIFKLLELDTKHLYSTLQPVPNEPVTVRTSTSEPSGHSIPKPPQRAGGVLQLDMSKVAALKAESEKVSAILGAIFTEEPALEKAAEAVSTAKISDNAEQGIMGLDSAHSDLVKLLSSRMEWSRMELEEIMTDRGLMLDGALEQINDAAFDHVDMPFTESDDPIEINQDAVKKIYA
ncbi:hypothetical protein TPL01_33470 [Sulfuriferula plumbiphila]|uniref:Tellurite resistance protein TerB n=1 Tax=Sulfuriferula plumbiphila TaxID=171865 RepID=A0A512LCJ6_9PROT|nr:TerB N-terminal domain-containing protein [Sulfuriferula plumbiphila]BBP05671.1 hypothetical protein SFPGR_30930 [Sulfuriferula plumbiphila]GEP32209.1 hypothetical protein TPL01_33470 [Sulfuriferula plumbiphila]